jgi:anti-anti-sigma factor
MSQMTFQEETSGAITIVVLGGQVDSINATELETRVMTLLDGGARHLLLDCGTLDYINSAGLRVFLLAAKRLEQEGGVLAFCELAPNVRLIFETIGFDRILSLYGTRSEAIFALNNLQAKAA